MQRDWVLTFGADMGSESQEGGKLDWHVSNFYEWPNKFRPCDVILKISMGIVLDIWIRSFAQLPPTWIAIYIYDLKG